MKDLNLETVYKFEATGDIIKETKKMDKSMWGDFNNAEPGDCFKSEFEAKVALQNWSLKVYKKYIQLQDEYWYKVNS